MKTTIGLKIDIDTEIMMQTEYTETEIIKIIMEYQFSNFKLDEYTVIDLNHREQIRVLPYFNIFNDLILKVTYF